MIVNKMSQRAKTGHAPDDTPMAADDRLRSYKNVNGTYARTTGQQRRRIRHKAGHALSAELKAKIKALRQKRADLHAAIAAQKATEGTRS